MKKEVVSGGRRAKRVKGPPFPESGGGSEVWAQIGCSSFGPSPAPSNGRVHGPLLQHTLPTLAQPKPLHWTIDPPSTTPASSSHRVPFMASAVTTTCPLRGLVP